MIPLFKVYMPQTVGPALEETLDSGYIGEGPRVAEFEEMLQEIVANPHVLALNSGTSAIRLALRLAGVGHGDAVISTPMTCSATNTPIMEQGAHIAWADVDPKTGNMDPERVAELLAWNALSAGEIKAVLCVHWGGSPCDLKELYAICQEHGVKLISDACHAFGAHYGGRPIGSCQYSDFACFSFQAIKLVTTGDGGALCCKSQEDYERGKLLRWFGIDRTYQGKDLRCEKDIPEAGYKYHMNDIAATMGIEQLKTPIRLGRPAKPGTPRSKRFIMMKPDPTWRDRLTKHRGNAYHYEHELRTLKRVSLLRDPMINCSSWWLYTILVEDKANFLDFMRERDIMVSQVHVRNDGYSMFRQYATSLPGVDEFASKHMCIPVGWWVEPRDLDKIVDAIKEYDEEIMT